MTYREFVEEVERLRAMSGLDLDDLEIDEYESAIRLRLSDDLRQIRRAR